MTGIIIQARMGSTRLPEKVMKDLSEKPSLWHTVERCRKSKKADIVIVATTTESADDKIANFCEENRIACYRGSLKDVLDRFYETASKFKLTTIIRANSDCPLIDPETIDRCVEEFEKLGVDYISNVVPGERTFPRGLDCEI
ncbi:MAG: NTP transferase domain-containing protein, partial [Patescibacteria group bacterium]